MTSAANPVPQKALDDRLGFVGTAGSGKTYGTGVLVEKLLAAERRTIIPDPLGVWWGLRAAPDGKGTAFPITIFGGPHGDLPITPHSGALIGETFAGMAESAILDLSQLGSKAAERRFMLAFLEALYRRVNGEPLHLVFDEADMWAPQRLLDKEGDAAKLLGMMETIVRRGRVKGFIPWLITQRPAVLSKDVLSQVDGLVIFKLTSSQDRDAIGDWVEGQADKGQWKQIHGELAGKERGHALVWLPGHGVLTPDVMFPKKATYDSSATPKRGEKIRATTLKPLDVGALKEKLASIETETKANDPKALRAEVAALKKQLRDAPAASSKRGEATSPKAITDAEARGEARAAKQSKAAIDVLKKQLETAMKFIVEINASGFFSAAGAAVDKAAIEKAVADATNRAVGLIEAEAQKRNREVAALSKRAKQLTEKIAELLEQDVTVSVKVKHNEPFTITPRGEPTVSRSLDTPPRSPAANASLEQRMLDALAEAEAIRLTVVPRPFLAMMVGYKNVKSGGFVAGIGALNAQGAILIPSSGAVALTEDGRARANLPDAPLTTEAIAGRIAAIIGTPADRMLATLIASYPNGMSRADLAAAVGYQNVKSGGFVAALADLKTCGAIAFPATGQVAATDLLFP